jgi:hypothetical protein
MTNGAGWTGLRAGPSTSLRAGRPFDLAQDRYAQVYKITHFVSKWGISAVSANLVLSH